MSTAALPGSLPSGHFEKTAHTSSRLALVAEAGEANPAPKSGFVRRRGSLEQGRALETLGHAVEYVIDSQLFLMHPQQQRDAQETAQVLMRLSRAVFAECPEVVPMRRRMRSWVAGRLGRVARTSARS